MKTEFNKFIKANRATKLSMLKDNTVFTKAVEMCLYPEYNLGIKNLKDIGQLSETLPDRLDTVTLNKFLVFIQSHLGSPVTNETRETLKKFIQTFNKEEAELLIDIATQKLRLGISADAVKKHLGKPVFSVALASPTHNKKLPNGSVVAQEKIDGVRLTISLVDDELLARTRQGKIVYLGASFEPLKKVFEGFANKGIEVEFIDGEIASDDGNRRTIAGLVTSAQHNSYLEIGNGVTYKMFDFLPASNTLPTVERVKYMDVVTSKLKIKGFEVVPSVIYNTAYQAITNMMPTITAKGGEGLILKLTDTIYKKGRSKNWLKVKAHNSCTLKVVGVYEGQGRLKGLLGGFYVETKEGLLKTKVGTGLTDNEREWFAKYLEDDSEVIGSLVEVEYTEVTYDTKGSPVLDHPVWGGFRTDKTEADTLDHIEKEGGRNETK